MAAHLTLEEAAEALGISADDFRKRLKTDQLFKALDRGKIRDGTSFRFKDSAVAELARELGVGSDPGGLKTVSPATPAKGTPKVKHEEPLKLSNDDDDDVFSLSNDDPKESGPKTSKFKRSEAIPTEEIAIDFSGPASGIHKEGGSSSKLSAPRSSTKLSSEASGKNLAKKPPKSPTDSEFELSLDGVDDAFELKLGGGGGGGDEEDDAIDLGELPKDVPGGSRVGRGGESGILSRKPNDTGRSLESKNPKSGKNPKTSSGSLPPLPKGAGSDSSEADVDFELTLDAGAGVSSSRLGMGAGAPKSKKKLVTDSDSEFELTLDDSSSGGSEEVPALDDSESEGKGDIFETDFEIPPMDPSGSEAVVMDSTDTDVEALEDGDTEGEASTSEVVLLEDEEDSPKPKGGRSSSKLFSDDDGDVDLADVDLEVSDSASGALRGVRDTEPDDDEEEEVVAAGAGTYRPVPWGVVPLLFLLPAFLLTLVGGLMGFELLQTMWGYQQPRKPAAPLVRSIASQFDMELKD